MKKSIIALGVVSVLLYGLVLVVSPDINTVITVIAGLAAALPFFGARSLHGQISGSRAEIRMV